MKLPSLYHGDEGERGKEVKKKKKKKRRAGKIIAADSGKKKEGKVKERVEEEN